MDNTLIIAAASIIGLSIVSAVALKGWFGWLALKSAELATGTPADAPANSITARIDLADLKERLRKLEAIAAGVEL